MVVSLPLAAASAASAFLSLSLSFSCVSFFPLDCLLTYEWIRYSARVSVCFDKVAAFDVRLHVQVGDQGAGLRGFAQDVGFAGWVSRFEGWERGFDC